jgi:hypothetical protein
VRRGSAAAEHSEGGLLGGFCLSKQAWASVEQSIAVLFEGGIKHKTTARGIKERPARRRPARSKERQRGGPLRGAWCGVTAFTPSALDLDLNIAGRWPPGVQWVRSAPRSGRF